ncbi:uncharacterized protein LOC110433104 [Sorghum bicolor]|uniref:uncharacterized protein LOC110433104 n=1 Tax=Sorghum bicolor TaxID=4558 RepID=UPI000B426AA9|nr:uncharacterized protein LOC110433104 [Sorghum bicolor]|eukprot:XP_021310427.1 uncharacterized protein LOC110433104 [Sorghum bicolor]
MFFVYLSADVFAGLATAEELAKGASVAQEGLAVPPRREPAPSALANRPSPADVLGPGASDPSITGWTGALREVHSLVGDRFRQKLRGMDFDTLLRVQYEHHSLGHHMAAALEERCSREVICRDEAIEALKKENETLEAEKTRLSEEVKGFASIRQAVEVLRKENEEFKLASEVIKKEKEEAEAAAAVLRESASQHERTKDLAVQRAEKAEDVADRLRKELDAERTSAAALQSRLQKAEVEAAAVVGLYTHSLAQFGGSTSAPPPSGDVGASLAWLKSHIRMLPDFVGGAVDFGALAAVSSFARLLRRGGCSHAEGVDKAEFATAEDVGEGTPGLRKFVRNFISSFWIRFGRAEAKKMAEARRAEEIAKKKAKVDKAGPSRPSSEARPPTQAEAEARDAGAKAPEGSGAKVSELPETSAPPPPQV